MLPIGVAEFVSLVWKVRLWKSKQFSFLMAPNDQGKKLLAKKKKCLELIYDKMNNLWLLKLFPLL